MVHTICGVFVFAGGDFGKKELSLALANRFTTVWVPAIQDEAELAAILRSRLPGEPFQNHSLTCVQALMPLPTNVSHSHCGKVQPAAVLLTAR